MRIIEKRERIGQAKPVAKIDIGARANGGEGSMRRLIVVGVRVGVAGVAGLHRGVGSYAGHAQNGIGVIDAYIEGEAIGQNDVLTFASAVEKHPAIL